MLIAIKDGGETTRKYGLQVDCLPFVRTLSLSETINGDLGAYTCSFAPVKYNLLFTLYLTQRLIILAT